MAFSDDLLEARYAGGPESNQSARNGCARACVAFSTGVHFWEVKSPEASGAGAGYPSVGVVNGSCPLGRRHEARDWWQPQTGVATTDGFEKVHAGEMTRLASGSVRVSSDTTYGLLLDMDRGELSLYVDGKLKEVAFTGLQDKGPLYPAVEAGTLKKRTIRANFEAPLPTG